MQITINHKDKTWCQSFAEYELPRYKEQIKYLYIFSIYAVGSIWVHNELKVSYIVLGIIFSIIFLFPVIRHLIRRSKPKMEINLDEVDTKNVNNFSKMIHQKDLRHEMMSVLYFEMHKAKHEIPTTDVSIEKARLIVDLMKMQFDVLKYFAEEGNKYTNTNIEDVTIPSIPSIS